MITITLTKFEYKNKKAKYGYVISEEDGIYKEFVDIYDSYEELKKEVNINTIEDVLCAHHYGIYKLLKEEHKFKFDDEIMFI